MKNYSGNIRKNLEMLKIHFNESAVVVLTTREIPIQLKIVASLEKVSTTVETSMIPLSLIPSYA